MEKWFCGFRTVNQNNKKFPKPLNSKLILDSNNPLWLCGEWKDKELNQITLGETSLITIGTCLVSKEKLINSFKVAINEKNFDQIIKQPGSYNLIIQDDTKTIVYTDIANARPIFFTNYEGATFYSSSAISLKELINSSVDENWIASALVGRTGIKLLQGHSPFKNIEILPPGHLLYLTTESKQVKQYWSPNQEYRDFNDISNELRNQILKAVEGRIDLYGSISSDLSGGLDSTSLTILGAKKLHKEDKKIRSVSIQSVTDLEDYKWAKYVSTLYKNIELNTIKGANVPGIYSHLKSLPLIDLPDPIMMDVGRINYLTRYIRNIGAQLHINGIGGEIFSSPLSYLADLLKHNKIREFFQHSVIKAKLHNCAPSVLILSALMLRFSSYKTWWKKQAKTLYSSKRKKTYIGRERQPYIRDLLGYDYPLKSSSWHTEKCIFLAINTCNELSNNEKKLSNTPGQEHFFALIQELGIISFVYRKIAEANGINIDSPYLDNSIIDTCFSSKPEDNTNLFQYKPLLSKALENDICNDFLSRKSKSEYTNDHLLNIKQNLNDTKMRLKNSVLADMDLVDISEVFNFLEEVEMGLSFNNRNIRQTIAVETWLQNLDKNSTSYWVWS